MEHWFIRHAVQSALRREHIIMIMTLDLTHYFTHFLSLERDEYLRNVISIFCREDCEIR